MLLDHTPLRPSRLFNKTPGPPSYTTLPSKVPPTLAPAYRTEDTVRSLQPNASSDQSMETARLQLADFQGNPHGAGHILPSGVFAFPNAQLGVVQKVCCSTEMEDQKTPLGQNDMGSTMLIHTS